MENENMFIDGAEYKPVEREKLNDSNSVSSSDTFHNNEIKRYRPIKLSCENFAMSNQTR